MSEADKIRLPIDAAQYILMLRIAPDELTYVYYNPAEDDSLVSNSIALPLGENRLQSIEQIVYSHDVLLQSYKKIYIVLPSQHFLLLPTDLANDNDNSAYFRTLFDNPDENVVETPLSHVGVRLLSGVENELMSFLLRTFDCPVLLHPLASLCEYFYRKSRIGNQAKVYVHLYKGSMDIVCFNRDGLLFANTFPYKHHNDAVYHILGAWQQLQLDQRTDEVRVAGDVECRRKVSALLRNYILTVVPVIFPSHCHVLGSDAMQIPFDLTALSLCEL